MSTRDEVRRAIDQGRAIYERKPQPLETLMGTLPLRIREAESIGEHRITVAVPASLYDSFRGACRELGLRAAPTPDCAMMEKVSFDVEWD